VRRHRETVVETSIGRLTDDNREVVETYPGVV
jgi:hypothetical protein